MKKSRSSVLQNVERALVLVRGQTVLADADLAQLFGVTTKRLNEQVKRNANRFGSRYTFQLTPAEFRALRSQSATSNEGRGGRRYLPWVFTEHGVVMAATVLDSEQAVKASRYVVEVFVASKGRVSPVLGSSTPLLPSGSSHRVAVRNEAGMKPDEAHRKLTMKLQRSLNRLLDTVIDHKRHTTVRSEAKDLISESIHHLKERLKKAGVENEEIAARATKWLAEAEKERSLAVKTRAEAEALEFTTLIRKLRLLIEAHRAMSANEMGGFLEVLRDLGKA